MKFGFKTAQVEKTFVFQDGYCIDGDQKLSVAMMLVWFKTQLATMTVRQPFVLTIGSLEFAMCKDENSTKGVIAMINEDVEMHSAPITFKETVSSKLDPEQKGFERIWIQQNSQMVSGDSTLSVSAFLQRIPCLLTKYTEIAQDDAMLYTFSRPDVNMEVAIYKRHFNNPDFLQTQLTTCARMLGRE